MEGMMKKLCVMFLMIVTSLPLCLNCSAYGMLDDLFEGSQKNDSFVDMANEFLVSIYGEDAPQVEGPIEDNVNEFMTDLFGDNATQVDGTMEENLNKLLLSFYGEEAPQLEGTLEENMQELLRDLFGEDALYIDNLSDEEMENMINDLLKENPPSQEKEIREALPEMISGKPYSAEPLPSYMDDLWSPYNSGYVPDVLVYTDTRTGLQGVADEFGNDKVEAKCKKNIDDRWRGCSKMQKGFITKFCVLR